MESSNYASNPAEIERGTLPSLLLAAVDRFGSAPALRNFVGETDEVTDLSYDDMLAVASQGAAGLRALGLEPGDRAAILSENRTEWALADQSCLFSRVIDVPIYDTLIAERIECIGGRRIASPAGATPSGCANTISSITGTPAGPTASPPRSGIGY